MPETSYIHLTAIVEEVCTFSNAIRPHVHVRRGAAIGDESGVGKNVYVDAGAVIGHRVLIQNNVSI